MIWLVFSNLGNSHQWAQQIYWSCRQNQRCGQWFRALEQATFKWLFFISIVIAVTFSTHHKGKQHLTLWFILKWRMRWMNFLFDARISFHFTGNDINRKANLLDNRALAWLQKKKKSNKSQSMLHLSTASQNHINVFLLFLATVSLLTKNSRNCIAKCIQIANWQALVTCVFMCL